MGSGVSAFGRKARYAEPAVERYQERVGLTDEEKDMLDAQEEPMTRRFQDNCWSCSQCGIALLDVWGTTLCHACQKRNDPSWHEGKVFTKPVVVYARSASKDIDRRHPSKISTNALALTSDHLEDFGRAPSKGSQAFSRSASKKSLQDDIGSRLGTKKSSSVHHGDADNQMQARLSSKSLDSERPGSKDGNRLSSKQVVEPQAHPAAPAAPAQPPPPPFSEFQGTALRVEKKHPSHSKADHHHHHHHHHHHAEAGEQNKAKRQALNDSIDQLAELKDEMGHTLQMGDRVIGEGKIGDDMGIGTITGANTSHGHGMVIVQFDGGGQTHPMKAEHLQKLEPRDEAEVLRRLEKAKKEKAKRGH